MTVSPPPPTMPLRVTRNDKIADGIHLFEFRDPTGKELPQFTAGAHIVVRVPNGLLRKYSLCNDPAERDRYQIAVKRETSGRGGSINLIDGVKAGDELIVTAPVNDFALPPRAQDFVFIAGGIGVTPMIAMITSSLYGTPRSSAITNADAPITGGVTCPLVIATSSVISPTKRTIGGMTRRLRNFTCLIVNAEKR